jgi:hypothetical protein
MKRLAVLMMVGVAALTSACSDGGAAATATAVYQRERATLEAYYTQSADQFAAVAAQAFTLEAELTSAAGTQVAAATAVAHDLTAAAVTVQAAHSALQEDLTALDGQLAATVEAQAVAATAAAEDLVAARVVAQATQDALRTAVAALEDQADRMGEQVEGAIAAQEAAGSAAAATLTTDILRYRELVEALKQADARLDAWQSIATPEAAQQATLAAAVAVLQTEVRYTLTPLPTYTPTPFLTFVPPPEGTPQVSFGPLYTHPDGGFEIRPPAEWTISEGHDSAAWINGGLHAIAHAFLARFEEGRLLNRFEVLLYVYDSLDEGYANFDSYTLTGFDTACYPMTMDFDVYDEGFAYISRQWFGYEGNVIWCLRIIVPANYPALLEYLGDNMLPTYHVHPDGDDANA